VLSEFLDLQEVPGRAAREIRARDRDRSECRPATVLEMKMQTPDQSEREEHLPDAVGQMQSDRREPEERSGRLEKEKGSSGL